jgi:large subunit ribosomal protein L3
MGARRATVQNLEVVGIDRERGLVLVKGGVPGARGGYVRITDAVKRSLPAEAPYPAGVIGNAVEAVANGGSAPAAEE